MKTLRHALLLLTVLCLVPAFARAEVHPNTASGVPAEQAFQVGDIDKINLFNGSLTLTIPIGGSYPVNGGFSYSLKLIYNSNPWLFRSFQYEIPGAPGSFINRIQGTPNPCSNAGLGWRVSLGRLNPPCQVPDANDQLPTSPIYQDETGTDHIFYPTLHAGDPAGPSDTYYTRDGSYLRLKIPTSGNRKVEFPDGTVREFNAAGMPVKISDAFANYVSIAYPTNQWVITDSQGLRTLTVAFRTDFAQYHQGVVNYIDAPVFGSATPYRYSFSYASTTIGRACPHSDVEAQYGNVPATVTVPLLTGVSLPDGSSWSTTAAGYVADLPASGQTCVNSGGNLKELTLPTLGKLAWTWQKYAFPTGSTRKISLQSNPGVATRTMKDSNGSVIGTWTYTPAPNPPNLANSREHTTTVVDPLGNTTVNYFSTANDLNFTGWSTYDYSLPFTRNVTLNVAPGVDLNLSRQVFKPGNVLMRSEYVLYERDPVSAVVTPDIYNTNRRPLRSRTVYEDDVVGGAATYSGAVNSAFDGLGHYRSQQTEGSFPGSSSHTHYSNFNPSQGTYVVNQAANTASGYTPFSASSPWVIEAPTYASDSEAGATAQMDFCYAPNSTAVTRKRVHRQDGATLGTHDLLAVYDVSAQGNVTAEKYYGGDSTSQTLGTGALCGLALPATPEYEIDHTYSYGVRATSKYAGFTFFSLDQDVEPRTGLISASRDGAGLLTSYDYDNFGRMTWMKPGTGQDNWTEYAYAAATSTNRANVTIRKRPNGSASGTTMAVDQIVFDAFGRVTQNLKKLPDNNFAKRETLYDAAGNKASVSEWTANSPVNKTSFLNYDPFGRAATIRPADGASHDVTMSYSGVRQVSRTVKIATPSGSENPATTTEIYDLQGRLASVTEPAGNGGAGVTTAYGYDMGDRLISVSTTASVGGSSVTQNRSFVFDRAGLLLSETHPEKGASGNGTVSYTGYDSRGHALRKTDGPNDVKFFYDAAERLDQVKEAGTNRLLKDFDYAPANGANDWRKGKLQTASRYNYLTIGGSPFTVQVTETYTYSGRGGRVSQRGTQVITNSTAGESFTQGFTYDDLGQVLTLDYPRCTHSGCTTPAAAVFADVPVGSANQREIEAIYPAVTGGCGTNPLVYCPNNPVTREQMAVFLLAAKEGPGYTPPACTTPVFADVPCTSSYAPWINELARRGITAGCSTTPLNYCPTNTVTNAQMSVFLLTTMGVSVPACPAAPFADVACTDFAAAFIAEESRRGITTGCGGGNFCPNSAVTRGSMAGLIARAFDIPVAIDPNTQRTVQLGYMQGFLTGVSSGSTTYGTLLYYPNLLVSQVSHGNFVTDTQGNDPNEIRRPASLGASGVRTSWSSGSYAYDGAGNIKTIGTSAFTYDAVSRLVSATVYDGPTGGGTQKQQSYAFDPFGNLTNITGIGGRATPTSAQTNRQNGTGTAYDAAGNLTNWNGAVYSYDVFNQMTRMTSGAEDWVYLYTADDERIWSYNLPKNLSRWTLRDLGGRVLREYQNNGGRWSVWTDYFYRDGLLLAAETQTGQRHFHLDHLGTPRLITRASGDKAAYHVYYPFGEEATAFNQDTERMKLTGHERDLASLASAGDDLDYMHARFFSPVTGRFLGIDIVEGQPKQPQTWNRYAYVQDNPLRYIDPDGQSTADYINGYINAFASDQLFGLFRSNSQNSDYQRGQARGDAAAQKVGAALVGMGTVGVGGALVAEPETAGVSTVVIPEAVGVGLYGVSVLVVSNNHMMEGENGTQVTSKTLYNKGGVRIDVENPNPGQRPGQVHIQIGNDKHIFDFSTGQFKNATDKIQKLLKDPKVQAAIAKGKKYLGL